MAMMASAASDPFNSFDDDNDLLETDPLDGGMILAVYVKVFRLTIFQKSSQTYHRRTALQIVHL